MKKRDYCHHNSSFDRSLSDEYLIQEFWLDGTEDSEQDWHRNLLYGPTYEVTASAQSSRWTGVVAIALLLLSSLTLMTQGDRMMDHVENHLTAISTELSGGWR